MITIETITRLDYASLMNKSKHELAMLVEWLIERIESVPTPATSDHAFVRVFDGIPGRDGVSTRGATDFTPGE